MFKQIGGSLGSVFAGACCLGFTPLLAALSAIGAGFLISDALLIPLFAAFLAFTLWSLWSSGKRHRRRGPFLLGLVCAITAFAALWFFAPLAYTGLVGVMAASVWDVFLLKRLRAKGGAPAVNSR